MATVFMQRAPQTQGTVIPRPASVARTDLWSLDSCLHRLRDISIWNVSPAARPAPHRRHELEARVAREFHACQLGAAQWALAHERRETARTLGEGYARRRGASATPAQGALLERARRRADEHLRDAGQQLAAARTRLGTLLNFDFTRHERLTPLTRPVPTDTLAALLARAVDTPVTSGLREHCARLQRLADLALHYQEKVVDHYREAHERMTQAESTALQLLRSHEKYFDAREVHLVLLAQSWVEAAELRLAVTVARLPADDKAETGLPYVSDRRKLA